jgi:ribosome-associated protein
MTDPLQIACQALDSKKASDIVVLDIAEIATFTRYFLICSGESSRQIQAIADEVEMKLKEKGVRANHIEGYTHAEWVLMDYMDIVVHIFSRRAREYYDLERLWRDGKRLDVAAIIRGSGPAMAARRAGARRKPAGSKTVPAE